MNKKDVVVLLSGGVDSTTCLAIACEDHPTDKVLALCMGYGQKHVKEAAYAEMVAKHYGVDLMVMDISSAFAHSSCTLLKGNKSVPHATYAEQLRDREVVSTYVPFRNGLFLSYAAAIAYSVGASYILCGMHSDDSFEAYPDCSGEFVRYMRQAIMEGTGRKVSIDVPFVNKTKADVVAIGLRLNVPYELTWSCYEGDTKPCGKCATCLDRIKAFEKNNVKDPLEY